MSTMPDGLPHSKILIADDNPQILELLEDDPRVQFASPAFSGGELEAPDSR